MRATLSLLLLSAPVGAAAAAPAAVTLTKFSPEFAAAHGARCLDGSPAGYYQSITPGVDRWIIHLVGGGACSTQASCTQRATTPLGSSAHWPGSLSVGDNIAVFDPDIIQVGDFAGWNYVSVMYCSGDGHGGQRNATSADTWGFYFSGHLIVKAVVADLLARGGLGSATDVMLTGDSAGGGGTYRNIDWLRSALPSVVRVVGVPNAGFHINATDFVTGEYYPAAQLSEEMARQDKFVDQSCLAAHPGNPTLCEAGPTVYPYITTPLFVLAAQYDFGLMGDYHFPEPRPGKPYAPSTDECTYFRAFGARARDLLGQVARSAKGDGVFAPSCFTHVHGFVGTVANTTFHAALANWYFARGAPTQLIEDCGADKVPCNPTCEIFSKKEEKVPMSFC